MPLRSHGQRRAIGFPPPNLITCVLKHMSAGGEDGTLLVPQRPSASWWPLLVNMNGSWKAFITGAMTICPYKWIFLAGSTASNIFTSEIPSSQILALRICFTSLFWHIGLWLSWSVVISRLQCTEGFVSFAVVAYSLSFLLVVTTVDILGCFGVLVCGCHGQSYYCYYSLRGIYCYLTLCRRYNNFLSLLFWLISMLLSWQFTPSCVGQSGISFYWHCTTPLTNCSRVDYVVLCSRIFWKYMMSSQLLFYPVVYQCNILLLSGDAHARRRFIKWTVFFFFSFCRSVVGTSGLAPSATSGPLILQVLRKICESCSLISPNLNLQDHFLASI